MNKEDLKQLGYELEHPLPFKAYEFVSSLEEKLKLAQVTLQWVASYSQDVDVKSVAKNTIIQMEKM